VGFGLVRDGFKDCVVGWGAGWGFDWVKVGLKTVDGWGAGWSSGWVEVGLKTM
jgi:hypothetical protein